MYRPHPRVPVAVSFASTGSSDADGSIVAYEWNFGDGSPVATTPSATHTYTVLKTLSRQDAHTIM